MERKWIVEGLEKNELVYLKVTKSKKRASKYLEECKEVIMDCRMRKGEFYTLEEKAF
ncbi:hypothetical protein [Sulfolobus super-elliptical virus]|nr:hypothetical protein [Sulfolobus super-elliptical virus]